MGSFKSTANICRVEGAMQPHGIPIPNEIATSLREAKTQRLIVQINGYEIRRGLQGSKTNGSHIVIGLSLLKKIGQSLDHSVSVIIKPDPEPNQIDLCDELLIALEQDNEANERWKSLTLGKQRGLAYHVSSAKREETRIKRALDIAQKLRTRSLHSDTQ
ncbi:YdeI/OmpD-associated family protein [Puniceicoccaceae bacterium K14]|nr:YdeI/OmpD-associated family protein [Puniceicoccaceae bacterium K14]